MTGADVEGAPRRITTRRGFSLAYQGKTLLSTVDPQGQADRIAGAAPKLDRTLYLCPSPLYGYGLERLLEGIGADSAVLCVERDPQLLALSVEAMGRLLRDHPRLRLVGPGAPESICAYVSQTWGSRRFRRVEALRLSGGWQLAAEYYETLTETLRRGIVLDWGNAMTLVKLGRRYLRNALRNLSLIPDAPRLDQLGFGDTPVLVLGAGPSLDGVLAELHRAGTSAFKIICVDTALPALRARNIRPDLAVALECQHWNLRDFIGMGDWNIPLAMDLSALPATGELLGGRPYLFFTPWTPLRIFDRLEAAGLLPERFPPLGSVGLTATALARRLSSGPVVVGGIDFSFFPDSFHARSTPSRLEGLRRQNRLQPLFNAGIAFRRGTFSTLSKTGIPVRSDLAMKGYRDLFEREFSGEPRIRDIAGSGLPLGLQTVTLPEALDILRDHSAGRSRPPSPPESARLGQALETFVREERRALITLRETLRGEAAVSPEGLEKSLDDADYLWAHFPDCAGAGGRRPPAADISFLRRIRVEIDPCIKLFDTVLRKFPAIPN